MHNKIIYSQATNQITKQNNHPQQNYIHHKTFIRKQPHIMQSLFVEDGNAPKLHSIEPHFGFPHFPSTSTKPKLRTQVSHQPLFITCKNLHV